MNITIRTDKERGHAAFDWLTSAHSFSFGEYYDPSNMGFGALRVLNDDGIAGGGGFPPHSHRNMEIFTIPLEGSLSHEDSTGTSSTIKPGDVQIMSAGTGVVHSEFNASDTEALTLLQIWIVPNVMNIEPRYDEKYFPFLDEKNVLHTIINPEGSDGALKIYQEAYVSIGSWNMETEISYAMKDPSRGMYIFVIEGAVIVEDIQLSRRDAAMVTEAETITTKIQSGTTLLFIEVPLR